MMIFESDHCFGEAGIMFLKAKGEGLYRMLIVILIILLIIAIIVSFLCGRYSSVMLSDVIAVIKKHAFHQNVEINAGPESVIMVLRLPRIIGACLIGAALGLSGTAYQSLFGNPIASPDTLGVSNAASFAAVLGIILGWGPVGVKIGAFAVGTLTVLSVFLAASLLDRGNNLTTYLLLVGLVFSSMFSAMLTILKYVADPDDQLPQITYWLMGSMTKITMADIRAFILFFVAGALPLLLLRWRMNLLSISEAEIRSMGENTFFLRAIIIICATLLTASSTAMTGGISWIGLIIPHIVRNLVGTDFKRIVPVSALMGALFLLIMDDLARSLTINELPISILTSMIGAPVFFAILVANRGKMENDR